MDIGKITANFPTLDEINKTLTVKFEQDLNARLMTILNSIAEQEQIPRDKLYAKYLNMNGQDSKCEAYCEKKWRNCLWQHMRAKMNV